MSYDVSPFTRGDISGVQRLVRHLRRMYFALFIAALSFRLGTFNSPVQLSARLFTTTVPRTHLTEVPVMIIVLLPMFWLWRGRCTNAYWKAWR